MPVNDTQASNKPAPAPAPVFPEAPTHPGTGTQRHDIPPGKVKNG